MGFEPQKFFIGLMEFFTILLPGAVLTYLSMGAWDPFIFAGNYKVLTTSTAMGGGAFFVVSYVTGHFLFLMGSLLDEYVYDQLRNKHSFNRHLQHVVIHKKVPSWWMRELSFLVFGRNLDLPLMRAQKIKNVVLGRLQATDDINTFQWAKLRLGNMQSDALATVNRHEADSKFFRSFFVLILLLMSSCGVNGFAQIFFVNIFKEHDEWVIEYSFIKFILLLILALFTFIRYVDLRFKAINQAYWGVIATTANEKYFPMSPAKDNQFFKQYEKVGGVLCRNGESEKEFLLIEYMEATDWNYEFVGDLTPTSHMQAFIFIEKPREDEHPEIAVTRIILSKTGYWSKILIDSKGKNFKVATPGSPKICCFVLEVLKKDFHHIDKSVHRWIKESDLKNNSSISEKQRTLIMSVIDHFNSDSMTS